jgi:hypothetical protein
MNLFLSLLPILLINYAIVIYCIFKIHSEGVENLSKLWWTLIVLFVNGFGWILFLLFGRRKHNDSNFIS